MPIFQAQSAHYFDMQEHTPIFNQLHPQDAKMKSTLEHRNGTTNGTTNGNTIAHPMAHPMFAAPAPKPAGSIPELQKLSDEISASTSEVSWYLSSTSHAQPSFERDTPISVLPKGAPESVRIARQKLKQAALDLFRLASGPEEYISHVALNHHYTICLRWLCHFDIFSIVPTQGSISYSNIAVLRSVSESQLKTVCRMAMTNGLFCEPTEGRITHSATSALLATNNDFGAWATCVSDYMYSTGSKLAQAGEKWPRSQQITESAFNLAFETPMPFPEYLGRNPGFARNFGGFMKATQQIEANDLGHLVRGFNWASLGKATVVDVGSTTAYPCIALARAFPDLKFISQPLPRTSADVKATIESLPQELASRITFAPHDMMMPQPENGAAVYLIRHVLHNMPLEGAAKVMANIAPAIAAGGRIIIMDLVLPQIGEMETYREGMLRMRELIQRELSNGHTRDLNDWTAVCNKAGTGFKIVNAVMPVGSDLGLLEISV